MVLSSKQGRAVFLFVLLGYNQIIKRRELGSH